MIIGKTCCICAKTKGPFLLLLLSSLLHMQLAVSNFVVHPNPFSALLATTPPPQPQSSSSLLSSSTKTRDDGDSENEKDSETTKENDETSELTSKSTLTSYSYAEARDIRIRQGHKAAVPLYKALLKQNSNDGHNDVTAATRISAAESSPWRHDQACPVPNDDNNKTSDEQQRLQNAIQNLKHILDQSHFDNQHIQQLFGIIPLATEKEREYQYYYKHEKSYNYEKDKGGIGQEQQEPIIRKENLPSFAKCPIYLKPQAAGTQSKLPPLLDGLVSSCTTSTDTSNDDKRERSLSSLKCLVTLFLLGFAGEIKNS